MKPQKTNSSPQGNTLRSGRRVVYSSRHIIKVLQREGFIFVSQKGSHVKFRKLGEIILTVIIPANRKEIPFGAFRSILRQAHLTEDDFKISRRVKR